MLCVQSFVSSHAQTPPSDKVFETSLMFTQYDLLMTGLHSVLLSQLAQIDTADIAQKSHPSICERV